MQLMHFVLNFCVKINRKYKINIRKSKKVKHSIENKPFKIILSEYLMKKKLKKII